MSEALSTELSEEERQDLSGYELVIERGRKTFIEVGAALMEVRDRKLYRETHSAFEDYCEERWQFGRNYANKLIMASAVVLEMGTDVPILPAAEAQARELARVEPEKRAEVWSEAVARNDGKPAPARVVAEVIKEKKQAKEPSPIADITPEEERRGALSAEQQESVFEALGRPVSLEPEQAMTFIEGESGELIERLAESERNDRKPDGEPVVRRDEYVPLMKPKTSPVDPVNEAREILAMSLSSLDVTSIKEKIERAIRLLDKHLGNGKDRKTA